MTDNTPVVETKDLEAAWFEFHQSILGADRILLSTHENPDGDGIGSELALAEFIKALGKECRIINHSPTPEIYNFLDPNGWVEELDPARDTDWLAGCDIAVILDIGNFARARTVYKAILEHQIPTLSIDHHYQTGDNAFLETSPYKQLVLDYSAPSSGTLVWEYLRAYDRNIVTPTMATALYAALVTDTGSFKYDNTDERAHLMAIALIDAGVKPYRVHKEIYEQQRHTQINLLGILIKNIEYSADSQIAWCVLKREQFETAGATLEDQEGLVEFIRSVKGVEIAVLVTELEPERTKLSFRSKGTVGINDVAAHFDGGGHPFASGASPQKPWYLVVEEMIPLLQAKLDSTDGI